MQVRMLSGVDATQLLRTMRELHEKALNSRGGNSHSQGLLLDAYFAWASEAARRLAPLVDTRAVQDLAQSQAYWALMGSPPTSPAVFGAVQAELDRRIDVLGSAIDELARGMQRWSEGFGILAVLDTNCFLEHELEDVAEILAAIEAELEPNPEAVVKCVQFVIPMMVIDELDKQKSDRARKRARTALRFLNATFPDPRRSGSCEALRSGSALHLLVDEPTHVRLSDPDSEIVDRAQTLAQLTSGRRVTVVAFDTGMALRSKTQDVSSFLLQRRRQD